MDREQFPDPLYFAFNFGKKVFCSVTSKHKDNSIVAPHLALIAVQLFFGTWPIIGKIVLRSISALELVALRVGGAAIALFLLQQVSSRAAPRILKSDYVRLAVCSLLGVVFNQLLFVNGLSKTTAINATLIGTTIPVFTLLVSLMLGYDRASWNKLVGVLIAGAGVFYLVNPSRANFSNETTTGDILLIANSISFGAYIAFSKSLLKRYDALTVITWLFIFASIITTPLGIFIWHESPPRHGDYSLWLGVLYIVLVPTVAAYYLNAWALARVAPTTVASYIYLQPLIAFIFAPLVLGEPFSSRTWIASALIFAGVAFVTHTGNGARVIEEATEHSEALGH